VDATRDKGGAQSGGVPKNSAIPVRFSDSRYHSGHPLLRVPFRVETTRTCRRYARFVPIVAVTTHNKSATHSTPQARHQVRQRDENFLKTLTDGRFFRAGESSDDFMTVFYKAPWVLSAARVVPQSLDLGPHRAVRTCALNGGRRRRVRSAGRGRRSGYRRLCRSGKRSKTRSSRPARTPILCGTILVREGSGPRASRLVRRRRLRLTRVVV
jgi:hypothetical protein